MERNIDIKKEDMLTDLEPILFVGGDLKTFRTIEGYTPTEEQRRYLVRIMIDAYRAGLHRVVTELNKEADREVAKAQKKAIDQILKMKY